MFQEHLAITDRGIVIDKAVWSCRNPGCLHEQFVRAEDAALQRT